MWITAIVIFVLLFADQLTKDMVDKLVDSGKTIELIPNILSVKKVFNMGAAWGMGDNATWLLAIISLVGTLILLFFLTRCNWKKYKFYSITMCLLFAGCTGNMIDRFASVIEPLYSKRSGRGVIDMVVLPFGNTVWQAIFHTDFPVWNIADACLVIGVILMIIYAIFFYEKDKAKGLILWK